MRVIKRRTPRRVISVNAHIRQPGRLELVGCFVRDVSEGGANLQVNPTSEFPSHFTLLMGSGARILRECEVVWKKGNQVGVTFKQ